MNRRELPAACLVALAAPVVLLGLALGVILWMFREHEMSSETVERGDVSIRLVKSVAEPMPGFVDFTYDLELRVGDERGFRRIAEATYDGDEPFGAERVLWIGDAHVVVAVLWRVLSSADGGRTWSEWNANDALLQGACCALLEAIEIDGTGHGIASARLPSSPKGTVLLVETSDFGRRWRQVGGTASAAPRAPDAERRREVSSSP